MAFFQVLCFYTRYGFRTDSLSNTKYVGSSSKTFIMVTVSVLVQNQILRLVSNWNNRWLISSWVLPPWQYNFFNWNLFVALDSVVLQFLVYFFSFLVDVFFNSYSYWCWWYILPFSPPRIPVHQKIIAFASIFVCPGCGKIRQFSTAFLSVTPPYFKNQVSNLGEVFLWNRKSL